MFYVAWEREKTKYELTCQTKMDFQDCDLNRILNIQTNLVMNSQKFYIM